MVSHHIIEALAQVRQLQQTLLQRFQFQGYSGPTRAISGSIALVMAIFMSTPYYPQTTRAHLYGWGGVLLAALVLNGGALLHWFFHDQAVQRNPRRLRPVMDIIPPLFIGAVMTAALILRQRPELLFGVWMLMFGQANLASRHVLPRPINFVGLFYIVAGTAWLLTPGMSFMHPWPMGIVFFAGEWAGGLILYIDDKRLEKAAPRFYEERGETNDDAS